MKTICFVVPNFPASSETFVINQIITLKQKGYKVCVLTHHFKGLSTSSQKQLLIDHKVLKDVIVIDYKIPKSNFKRIIFGLLPILRHFKSWLKTPDMSTKHRFVNLPYVLNFYTKLRHIDVFHIQFAGAGKGVINMTENGFLRAKVITTFHGHDAHYRNQQELQKLCELYDTLFKYSAYITVNTPYLKPNIIALGCPAKKIKIIPMGIDVDYFKSLEPKKLPGSDSVGLISIGRLVAFKGFHIALKSVKILVENGLNVHYTIVGAGNLHEQLKKQIKTEGLDSVVSLVGNKSQKEIRHLLEVHHIYLMSSITNSKGRTETQGVVTAEAQAMGLPVVAFNCGGIPYTIQDNFTGVLVPENDIHKYAEAILEVISQPDVYESMSKNARVWAVNKFSMKLMTERFIELYYN